MYTERLGSFGELIPASRTLARRELSSALLAEVDVMKALDASLTTDLLNAIFEDIVRRLICVMKGVYVLVVDRVYKTRYRVDLSEMLMRRMLKSK